jgi:hypothetical protein
MTKGAVLDQLDAADAERVAKHIGWRLTLTHEGDDEGFHLAVQPAGRYCLSLKNK